MKFVVGTVQGVFMIERGDRGWQETGGGLSCSVCERKRALKDGFQVLKQCQ